MKQYAKYIDENTVRYPTDDEFKGIPNWHYHDEQLRNKNYVPLIGEPEYREDYIPIPNKFSYIQQSEVRNISKEIIRDDYIEDPETHEKVKSGQHSEWIVISKVFDISYIQILEWRYDSPEPIPDPSYPERDAAELVIVTEIVKLARKYNAIDDLISIDDLTIPNLYQLSLSKGVTEEEFNLLITKLTPYKWQLEAVTGLTWSDCWIGLKSRFIDIVNKIIN